MNGVDQMDWIESHKAILRHRKTGRLMRALDISRLEAIGLLHAFWWWCLDNAPDGDLQGIDAEDIADGACWEGEPRQLLQALTSAGWVDEDEQVHEWMDYAGKLIVRQKADRERKRNSRLNLAVQGTSDGLPTDGVETAYVPNPTIPNPTIPNPTIPNPTIPNQEPPLPPAGGVSVAEENFQEFFTEFMQEYPVDKDGKKPGGKRIQTKARAIKVRDRDDVLTATRHYAQTDKAIRGFVKTPESFLAGDYWRDYIEPPQPPKREAVNGADRPATGHKGAQAAQRNFARIGAEIGFMEDIDNRFALGPGPDTS